MGYDISYHPVDITLIQDRVIPFIAGVRDVDDLLESGTRIARNRYISNAWGLAANSVHSERFQRMELPKKSLMDRLLNRASVRAEVPQAPFEFEAHLYTWGRPFFITSTAVNDVSTAIDKYLSAAGDDAVNVLAQDMIENLKAGLSQRVSPDFESGIPSNDALRQSFSWRLQLFRRAFDALSSGNLVALPDGDTHDPLQLFSTDFPLTAICFMAHFRPGWMARGYVWPTHLLQEAGLEVPLFSSASELFRPLCDLKPEITFDLNPTIEENYSLGGYVAPPDVPRLRAFIETNYTKLLAVGISQGWEYDCRMALQKLQEAVKDAEKRGLGFLEASEVYSGSLGIMN